MKVVNFFKIPSIAQVHQIMKIPPNYYTDFDFSKIENFIEWEDPLKQGIEISVNDIADLKSDKFGFSYKGRRVRLYLRDRMIQWRDKLPSYHLTWCSTLKKMHNRGQYEKYVVQRNVDDYFTIKWVDGNKVVEETREKLNVCKNCLLELNWKGYSNVPYKDKTLIFQAFSIEEFFEACDSNNESFFAVIPLETDITAPDNVYPNDWKILSRYYRENHLECAKCHRKFTIDNIRGLQVHHRNGLKNDCRRSNLVVLCDECHQKEHPDHQISLWNT